MKAIARRAGRWAGPIAGVAALAALVLWVGGVFSTGKILPGRAPEPPGLPAPPHTGTAEVARLPERYEAVGTLRSRVEATVAAQVTGRVVEVAVDEGGAVKTGDLVVALESDEFRARLEQARSGLDSARALQERAAANHGRVERLFEQKAATPEELESAEAERRRADAGVAAAEQKLEEARVAMAYTRIAAPMDGVVARRLVDPGDLAWSGRPLAVIHDPARLELEASVREGLIGAIAAGDTVDVFITASGETLSATVREVVPAADPVSRSFVVRASLPSAAGLYPGMFGKLRLAIGERDAVLAPARAVTTVGQLKTVRVLRDGRWERRYVTVGERVGDAVEVLSGLSGGETLGWEDGAMPDDGAE